MFETYKFNEQGHEEVKEFKTSISKTMEHVLALMPEGREKSIFITKLEEAVFFGAKAIASKKENHTEILTY